MAIGRNERCPCGSGKKYKKCCGGDDGKHKQEVDPEDPSGTNEKTPATITAAVRTLASDISHGSLSFVTIKPFPASRLIFCYENVEAVVAEQGGERIFGWKIWECRHWIKAVHHAVWKSPDGDLIDITPEPGETQTLFLTDDQPRSRPVPPIIVAKSLRFEPVVRALIEADTLNINILHKRADGEEPTQYEEAQSKAALVRFGLLLKQTLATND
jgi:hypothetical protein